MYIRSRVFGRQLWCALALKRRPLESRRGAVSILFGVSAAITLGAAALVTDAGYFALKRSQAQTAADLGALSAAAELAAGRSDTGAVRSRALALVGQNLGRDGIAPEIVGVDFSTSDNAFALVTIEFRARRFLSFIKIGDRPLLTEDPLVRVRARASYRLNMDVCALARHRLIFTGTSSLSADCGFASNGTDGSSNPNDRSVQIQGTAEIHAQTITAVGTCSGCDSANVHLESPPRILQPARQDFFAYAATAYPDPGGCQMAVKPSDTDANGNTANLGLVPRPDQVVCRQGGGPNATLKWNIPNSFQFQAGGTYYFRDTDIVVNSGASINGPVLRTDGSAVPQSERVTIVLLGRSSISVTGSGSINLTAPDSVVDPGTGEITSGGLVIYHRGSGGQISLQGDDRNPLTQLNGGIYYPDGTVSYSGSGGTDCSVVVANTVYMTGNSLASLGVEGCQRDKDIRVPQLTWVRLVE